MSDTFGVRAVTVRDESVLLEVTASAAAGIADQVAGFARFRSRRFYSICIRLIAIEYQRNRNIERTRSVEFESPAIDID
jgi:hypothetical protein